MQLENNDVPVADEQPKKMVPVYKVNEVGERADIYCRNFEDLAATIKDFLDGDGYLEDMQHDEDYGWQFTITTVFMSEAELNALEPFER